VNFLSLVGSFEDSKRSYTRLKKFAEANAVREEWSNGPIRNLEPLEMERAGETMGALLAKKPVKGNDKVGYGLDALGRVMWRMKGTAIAASFYEEFFRYDATGVWSASFGSSKMKELINVKFRAVEEGRIVSVLLAGKKGNRSLKFNYVMGRVVDIDVSEFRSWPVVDANNFKSVVTYSESGDVSQIVNVFPNGHRAQIFPAE
jgi:hypothetical protein